MSTHTSILTLIFMEAGITSLIIPGGATLIVIVVEKIFKKLYLKKTSIFI